MVNDGHKSAAHTDSPDGVTGKTYLGGGMHCPIASSLSTVLLGRNAVLRTAAYCYRPYSQVSSIGLSVCLSK